MNKLLYLSFFVAVLTIPACGFITAERYIDPEIYPYIEDIERNVDIDPIDYDIKFGKTKETSAGVCRKKISGKPKAIRINLEVWDGFTDNQRRYLLMHEIGHCTYHFDHDNRRRDDRSPVNVMHKNVANAYYIRNNALMRYYYQGFNEMIDNYVRVKRF